MIHLAANITILSKLNYRPMLRTKNTKELLSKKHYHHRHHYRYCQRKRQCCCRCIHQLQVCHRLLLHLLHNSSNDEFSDGGRNDSTNGSKNNNDDSNLSLSFRRKTVIAYRLKAFLRRKPGVRLTTDTDVKCYAE